MWTVLRDYGVLLMMFHLQCGDVEVIAVADLQSEDGGRPDEAVSCLLKAAVRGCCGCCRLVSYYTPVWASWSEKWKEKWMKNSVRGERAHCDVCSVSSRQEEDSFWWRTTSCMLESIGLMLWWSLTLHVEWIWPFIGEDVTQCRMMQCDWSYRPL